MPLRKPRKLRSTLWVEPRYTTRELYALKLDLEVSRDVHREAHLYHRPCPKSKYDQDEFGFPRNHRYASCEDVTCPDKHGHGYAIDVSSVLDILNLIESGKIQPCDIATQILSHISRLHPRSGCCLQCDEIFDEFEIAIEEFEAEVEDREKTKENRKNADYLIVKKFGDSGYRSREVIHLAGCAEVEIPVPIHPGERHAYGSDRYYKRIERYNSQADGIYELLSFAEFDERYGPLFKFAHTLAADKEYRFRRSLFCTACAPRVQQATQAQKKTPACWSWPRPAAPLATTTDLESVRLMRGWQGNRCAVCGLSPTILELDHDHDHDSRLIRGFLCKSCNSREGNKKAGRDEIFVRYRRENPATILKIEVSYKDVAVRRKHRYSRYWDI
jgi:hypothetical protein